VPTADGEGATAGEGREMTAFAAYSPFAPQSEALERDMSDFRGTVDTSGAGDLACFDRFAPQSTMFGRVAFLCCHNVSAYVILYLSDGRRNGNGDNDKTDRTRSAS
jgi:hypothetical protein